MSTKQPDDSLLYLIPYTDDTNPLQKDAYRIYNILGGKYYCPKNSFPNFAHYFLRLRNVEHCLTMDLSSTPVHTLIFDIDVKYEKDALSHRFKLNYFDTYCLPILKAQFLPRVKNVMVLVAARNDGGGLHIHFPEIMIAHDDYIRLCTQLQEQFARNIPGMAEFRLDILNNATLSNSMKPNTLQYHPIKIIYLDEKNTYSLNFTINSYGSDFDAIKEYFKKRKDNGNSYFRRLLPHELIDIQFKLKEYMMPVPVTDKPLYRLSYPTHIIKGEMDKPDEDEIFEKVAMFSYKRKHTMYIYKGSNFQADGIHWQKTYYFLKFNAFNITDFESSYHALNLWYKRSQVYSAKLTEDVFLGINQTLREDNYNFAEDPNPIRTLLEFKHGYFFLPVFYALCQHLKMSSKTLIQHLRGILDDHTLLDALDQIDSKLIHNISRDFTVDTILFCGSNMIPSKCTRFKDFLLTIVEQMKGVLFTVSTSEQMVEHIRHIQERHLPIVVATLRNSCKKPVHYMWNCIHEYWQEFNGDHAVKNLINNIWSTVITFLKMNGPKDLKELLKEINLSYIVSAICNETNVDRQIIEMDRHKWLIRTNCGILDLLTGHVGGTVPQYFMSDRQLGISFDRPLLTAVRHDRLDIVLTYRLLTQKPFFQSYLKKLFMNHSDDLVDTLRERIREEDHDFLKHNISPLVDSMHQMYVHLCKFASFDYDQFMFLLDVATSLLIATNYSRKFFIFKGETRNGKSKFFQMLCRVFGGYSHTIRSVNLNSGNSKALVAQPELASSLFNCRLVAVEELCGKLNENLIKEITGNSNTSFRNLYEQNMGGIPTAKLFASMNTLPVCTATEAFKDRVIAFPCESEFTEEADHMKTSEQVFLNKYPLDASDSVVDDSYEGFFLLMYQHFIHNANLRGDGTLKYRKEPLSMVEFKTNFLLATDMFVQFKQYADIQIVVGCMTTFNDLKSAIRQYLKQLRNTYVQETDLLIRFEEEFGHLKKTDIQLDTTFSVADDTLLEKGEFDELLEYGTQLPPPEEEEEEVKKHPKKKKKKNASCLVYYENIVIKNIRKEKNTF